jgi:hypothetical protein
LDDVADRADEGNLGLQDAVDGRNRLSGRAPRYSRPVDSLTLSVPDDFIRCSPLLSFDGE